MPARDITDAVRRQLWWRAGRRCAFPGCERKLFEEGLAGEEVYVGHECHIVAKKDDPRVARSPSSLTPDEQARWRHLIDDRHGVENLVLMCQTHSKFIDTPTGGFTVNDVVDIKASHEVAVASAAERERAERFHTSPSPAAGLRVLVLDDVDEWERASLRALAAHSAGELAWLTAAIGTPSDGARTAALVTAWPEPLASGSRELQVAVARAAERHGRWKSAARAWELVGTAADGAEAADLLARAAIAADTAHQPDERERLLEAAQAANANSLRLQLAQIDDDAPPAELLAELSTITPGPNDDPALIAQLHLQRARAAMLNDDLKAAEEHLMVAQEQDAKGLATRMMEVNVIIQRGRVGVRDDRDFASGDVRGASAEALKLRARMVEMRRFDESARMLMLAADAWAVLRDPSQARPLLDGALADELATKDGPVVLADCALRCGHSDLALRYVNGLTDDAARRIAATARADLLPNPAQSLAELEQLAVKGGAEAVMAAAARLGACLPPVNAPFSEAAAEVLEASPHARMAAGIRVLTLARAGRHTDAEALLDDLPETNWAAELRLRAAGMRGAHPVIAAAAERLLARGPDPAGRLLAATGLARSGQSARAATELLVVAQSASAPPALRSDAYATLMRLCADEDDWSRANTLFREWAAWAVSDGSIRDGRISAWQVRIAHHGGYAANSP